MFSLPSCLLSATVAEQSAEWNPSDKNASITLSNGNRDATGGSLVSVRGLLGRSTGKYYFEYVLLTSVGSHWFGLGNGSANIASYVGNSASSAGLASGGNAVNTWTKDQAGTFSVAVNDVIGFAVDMGAGKAWVSKNNVWQLTGDPAAGTNQWISGLSGSVYPMSSPAGGVTRINTKTAELSYSPPSGFSQWAAP